MQYPVNVDSKTGFYCPLDSVYITDSRGLPFYEMHEAEGKEGIYFNLPVGNFIADCELIKLPKPIEYKTPELPKAEKTIPPPVRTEIKYVKNRNKCSVKKENDGTMKIFCDPSFLEQPRHFRVFVFLHELGHYLYYTEVFCDLFSAKKMLELGYNPSQCFHGSAHTLRSEGRTDKLYEFLKQVKPCYKKMY